ncbi:MAG: hypothetical protein H7124_13075 [Phycisphaerales bacterium]|nr:hypothetical protein [Hyphomonadaceae bacterium]
MSFGKRPSTSQATSAPPPPADAHARRKVFPTEVWQGESGDMLRMLGMTPDDESNLAPNAASINARIEQGRATMEGRFVQAQRNAQAALASAQVRPFFLIPDPCWNGPTGAFLMTSLELYPYDDWNVMFLAADDRTAAALDIALHPNGNVAAFVQASEKFMAEAQIHMEMAHDDAGRTQDFAAYYNAREDVRGRVKLLAGLFAKQIVEAWQNRGPGRGV